MPTSLLLYVHSEARLACPAAVPSSLAPSLPSAFRATDSLALPDLLLSVVGGSSWGALGFAAGCYRYRAASPEEERDAAQDAVLQLQGVQQTQPHEKLNLEASPYLRHARMPWMMGWVGGCLDGWMDGWIEGKRDGWKG